MTEKLFAVTPYGPDGASSRVRVFDWLRHEAMSAEVFTYTDGRDHSATTLLAHPLKLIRAELQLRRLPTRSAGRRVLLSRSTSPISSGQVEASILRRAELGVYDFDDALYADSGGRGLRAQFPKAHVWREAVSAADRVIAGNEVLAEHAARFCKDVCVIPSCVDPAIYARKVTYQVASSPRLVWVGSPSTEAHLLEIAQPLRWAHRRFGARLVVVSRGEGPLPGLEQMTDRLAWSSAGASDAIAAADVAVAPLRDDEYARGKCAYKILQYGAGGLPTIASPVGSNLRAVQLMDGLSPRSESEWCDALEVVLTESEERRRQRGLAAVAAVRTHYSFDAWADVWRRAITA